MASLSLSRGKHKHEAWCLGPTCFFASRHYALLGSLHFWFYMNASIHPADSSTPHSIPLQHTLVVWGMGQRLARGWGRDKMNLWSWARGWYRDAKSLEGVEGLEEVARARRQLKCEVCSKKKQGACILCAHWSCVRAYHVTCAQVFQSPLASTRALAGGFASSAPTGCVLATVMRLAPTSFRLTCRATSHVVRQLTDISCNQFG